MTTMTALKLGCLMDPEDDRRLDGVFSREERRQIVKEGVREAVKEFLSEQAQAFGWWSIRTLGGIALAVLVYAAAKFKGLI